MGGHGRPDKALDRIDDIEGILSDAQTGKGSRGLSALELEMLLPIMAARGLTLSAMECYQRETETHWPLRMDFSWFWEEPQTAVDHRRTQVEAMAFVRETLVRIGAEGKKVAVLIWLDDLA